MSHLSNETGTPRRGAGSEVRAVGGARTVRVGFGSVRRLAGQGDGEQLGQERVDAN
jgi:hypothetical protein